MAHLSLIKHIFKDRRRRSRWFRSHRAVGTDSKILSHLITMLQANLVLCPTACRLGFGPFECPLHFLLTQVKVYLFIYFCIALNYWQKYVWSFPEQKFLNSLLRERFLAKRFSRKLPQKSNTFLCVVSIVNILTLCNTSLYFIFFPFILLFFFFFAIYIRPHNNLMFVWLCYYWRKTSRWWKE